MKTRAFGRSGLAVSEVGFGAWAIGGPAMAGDTPIGWGAVDDDTSVRAIHTAIESGITFFDTADFYGLGHSEELIGAVIGDRQDIVVATKVGHRLRSDDTIFLDYSAEHIRSACEESLRRLRRSSIDVYQLHSAKLEHLERGDCIEAMERLKDEGKIRYWGLSLNTYDPFPEANFMMARELGDGFQLVLNVINQRAAGLVREAGARGYGIIARMPLQFGLLTGKFAADTQFDRTDHRSFRLTPPVLREALDELDFLGPMADRYGTTPAALALSYVLDYPEVSTVIPGIRTPEQAQANASGLVDLTEADRMFMREKYALRLETLLERMHAGESR